MSNAMWKILYDNDTGPSDEGFCEWWIITNGEKEFKCFDEGDAKWLVSVFEEAGC